MKTVYAIVRKTHGQAGHGEAGCVSISLANDGDGRSVGRLWPLFFSENEANSAVEQYNQANGYRSDYTVVPMALI